MRATSNPERRRFLKALGVGTAAAGTAAAVGHVTLVQAEDEQKAAPEKADTHYRETPHIRAFYATLRD
ncbi:twin-arginine translocation signal domain-containing protein [Halomonas sp. KAO]|uniref:twin-arginine translocation signal domain-containing protein n=1 Tax=unclassified Halomonas TaxID=2609666 RepID=UPI00189F6D2F|nr:MULTISPECIES: twin-arginine translocation signal domain-containing protein [unclassified Halomonas]MBF7052395.1 twin-arginine translocation signal domain-containing protein [Halomonas sp. KAO]MDT0499860.1 twin-arginine translocation signal domain-containing protein [Halomonas sp. PAR7]MDT0510323.1 twin-arginine translocation signal domain-containing protein [Halomonas sp. LES1]MDT0589968.1 twin-arginine translocation signal domain-containing protein [Halomonas sp. PAR8]